MAELRAPQERRVAGPAGSLAVWEYAGDPPDTLLLHGVGGMGRMWDFFATAVAGRLRMIAPDARGHGDSVKPPVTTESYGPEAFVADAAAILDAYGLNRVFLVGHSMGGGHAVAFTLAHPERVRALVIIDIGPTLGAEGLERTTRLSTTRPEQFIDRTDVERYLRETSPGYSDEVYAHRLHWLFRRTDAGYVWRSDARALARILGDPGTETAGSPERARNWAMIAAITVPTLIVRGTRSTYLGEETAKRMIETMPDARLLELDAGHNVQLDQPQALADAVVAFGRSAAR
ncbi:MAG: alpha/beta hydrolase [Candidatus Limnocylindrales bacterium]